MCRAVQLNCVTGVTHVDSRWKQRHLELGTFPLLFLRFLLQCSHCKLTWEK